MRSARKPLAEKPVVAASNKEINSNANDVTDEMTVEEYLESKCEEIIRDLKRHGDQLVDRLQTEYTESAASIRSMMMKSTDGVKKMCVSMKVLGGPHLGQKFRLEPTTETGEDVFKIGRSTGRHFKEKGVSLYKDKEISTTHAKIETRNGSVFLIDVRSTNGTQVNGEDLEPQAPFKLKEGDIIFMGSTEIKLNISDFDDLENVEEVSV